MQLKEEQWKEITEDADFTESYRVGEDKPRKNNQNPSSNMFAGNLDWLKYFFYALILLIIVVIVRRLLKSFDANPAVNAAIVTQVMTVEEAEERIHEADLEAMLAAALAAGNYTLALRVRFLMLIKALSEKGHIAWTREKTNWQYYAELRDRLAADQFRELVRQFERTWYGGHAVNEQQYRSSLAVYDTLQKWAAQ